MTSEAFLVGGVRTPFGRYRGALAEARPDDLAAEALKGALERAAVPGDQVDDVIFGAANQAGEDNRNVARMAVLLAGLPDDVPGYTVNRLCASGLQAIVSAAQQVRTGEADVVVAGGVESMTRAPMVLPKPGRAWGSSAEIADTTLGWRLVNPRMRELDGGKATISLGETAEEVAVLDGITREDSDAFGLRSQQLAAAHGGSPTRTSIEVAVDGGVVAQDEVPRPDTTAEALAGLEPAFRPDGIVTAGSASPLSDGAGAIVVASERAVERLGLEPRARLVAAAAAGVPPHIMGLGPVPSTEKVLERTGWRVDDLDAVEINEAFAPQVIASVRRLGLDPELVNAEGGAIALGHPLGATGIRLTLTLLGRLERSNGSGGASRLSASASARGSPCSSSGPNPESHQGRRLAGGRPGREAHPALYREETCVEALQHEAPETAARPEHDDDGDGAESDQVPAPIVGKQLLQHDEERRAEDRALDRPYTADDDDEDHVHRPVDGEGGIRLDAKQVEVDDASRERAAERRDEVHDHLRSQHVHSEAPAPCSLSRMAVKASPRRERKIR